MNQYRFRICFTKGKQSDICIGENNKYYCSTNKGNNVYFLICDYNHISRIGDICIHVNSDEIKIIGKDTDTQQYVKIISSNSKELTPFSLIKQADIKRIIGFLNKDMFPTINMIVFDENPSYDSTVNVVFNHVLINKLDKNQQEFDISFKLPVKTWKDKKTGCIIMYNEDFDLSSYGNSLNECTEMMNAQIGQILLMSKPKK